MLWSDENTFCAPKKQNNDFIQQYLVMGDFKTLLHEDSKLNESFVSNQWFGACIKLPNSRPPSGEPLKFRNTYHVTKPLYWNHVTLALRTADSTRWFIMLQSFLTQCFEIGHHYISHYFVFLAHQKYSRRFIILILNHCTHMNCFKYVFSTFLGIEKGN